MFGANKLGGVTDMKILGLVGSVVAMVWLVLTAIAVICLDYAPTNRDIFIAIFCVSVIFVSTLDTPKRVW